MNRYVSSLIITSLLYLTVIASVLYAVSQNNYSDKNVKADNVRKVNFTIISPKNKPEKEKPKPKPKPEPKQKPEPKLEQEPEPEPIKEVQEEQVQKQEIATNNTNKKISQDNAKAKKELFISSLIKQINSNKSYPRSARRRCIEGNVDVEFTILADGNVEDVNILSGKNVFKNSTIQAIKKSFPVAIDSSLFSFPKKFKIKIAYILK